MPRTVYKVRSSEDSKIHITWIKYLFWGIWENSSVKLVKLHESGNVLLEALIDVAERESTNDIL